MFSLAFIHDLVIDSIGLGEGEKSEEGLELIVIVIVITSARVQREKRMPYSSVNMFTFRSCDYPGDSYLEMIPN